MIDEQGEKGRVVWEIRKATDKDKPHYAIFCPACKCLHVFDGRWTFNGNFDKPTFKPSMLINKSTTPKTCNVNRHRCHSFVTDGKIKLLGDCTHDMKNMEIELKPY